MRGRRGGREDRGEDGRNIEKEGVGTCAKRGRKRVGRERGRERYTGEERVRLGRMRERA